MPVVKQEISPVEKHWEQWCAEWNGRYTLPRIAQQLIEGGPEFGTADFDAVGSAFRRYFGKPHSLSGDPAKRDWEVICDIVYAFQNWERKK